VLINNVSNNVQEQLTTCLKETFVDLVNTTEIEVLGDTIPGALLASKVKLIENTYDINNSEAGYNFSGFPFGEYDAFIVMLSIRYGDKFEGINPIIITKSNVEYNFRENGMNTNIKIT